MIATTEKLAIPTTLEEFVQWESNDGFKYEWNDGELIQFKGMDKKQVYIYELLNKLFIQKGHWQTGTLVSEYDVMLSGIQMRRPDIAYLSSTQIKRAKQGIDEIPALVMEIISGNDNINKVEAKITEYYKAGVQVVWLIFPEEQMVHVYTSRRTVKICLEEDICSANPVLPDFEVSVAALFAD
ncbi:MAG: Uma2 family endonuclease [Cytophagia bacterium]|nr:MAG: Uma2 family endonuclease [Runella sp.]TAG21147.1 MAG: Uma2 family endonuclease [Cytophagales bacterium]TAG40267.1 MAG: Uma2 family endonuclease [Cytophagia bacterium]TAG52983.1 MAG: Uma2 family endonuclease [Runella slithyformis]TAG71214.1 MAG: Uma2 family endonuclease [Runella slithyformis]